MSLAPVGAMGAVATGVTASVTPAFAQATILGNLLVCAAISGTNTAFSISGPGGWINAGAVGQVGNRAEIWYKPNCSAGETAPTVNCALAVLMAAALSEWIGAAPTALGPVGTATSGAGGSLTVTTTTIPRNNGSVGIAVFGNTNVTGSGTWTAGAGWSVMGNDLSSNLAEHFAADSMVNPPVGSTLSELGTVGGVSPLTWSAVIAMFLPAPVASSYGFGTN